MFLINMYKKIHGLGEIKETAVSEGVTFETLYLAPHIRCSNRPT
jgi:hypothetical protein